MYRYVVRRLLLVILTLFSVSIIVFGTVRLIPGDLIDRIVVENVRRSGVDGFIVDRDALEQALGLDVPIYIQYGRWLGKIVFRGDLSVSLRNGQSVTTIMKSRVLVTFELGLMALVIGILMALPIGIYSALRQDTIFDYLGRSTALIGLSLPNFWLATMVMIFPVIWWGWSPDSRADSFHGRPAGKPETVLSSRSDYGDGHGGKRNAYDAHHDAGGVEARLYQDCLFEGSQGEGGGQQTRTEERHDPSRNHSGSQLACPGRRCRNYGEHIRPARDGTSHVGFAATKRLHYRLWSKLGYRHRDNWSQSIG